MRPEFTDIAFKKRGNVAKSCRPVVDRVIHEVCGKAVVERHQLGVPDVPKDVADRRH